MGFLASKIYKILFLVVSILTVGTVGYMLLSHYSFIDALYMTVITVTTVGFGEVQPFTPEDKIFTIFLILTSITIFGYAVSAFSEYLVSGQFFEHFKHRRVEKQIAHLEGHTIVCGYGRNGKQAIVKLQNYNKDFVVVEKNKEMIALLDEQGLLNIHGDATLDETLINAGILKATALIAALPSDANNLFIVLTASQLNKNCRIISRASDESSYSKLKIAGADNVIMPDKLGGNHMASLVTTPDVIEFVDRLTIEGETTANLEEIDVDELPVKYIGKTILDLDLRRKTGCTVIGFRNPDKDYIINPEAGSVLINGSHLIVLGRPEQITKLRQLF
ncbi:potassium channel protein [Polaribacter reichenbachii]|uniref:Potassium transporter TrkA n=1 Tax=Polaribacter reichenbachii TaxID=996801 RepID=A0A1B8U5K4_9FLAO|nr:potassium channel protein [Polaribacter reichenbachii]APZ46624.1 potassium channel protein [Polaribacter reichenbachii]AUC17269.1 potassium channel protein [Polaribacter reichenbachii]OBY67133.1 potassium transporter TrkA [Polaribacter reichenbachii]